MEGTFLKWQWAWNCHRCPFVHRMDSGCNFSARGNPDPEGKVLWIGNEPYVWQEEEPDAVFLRNLEAVMDLWLRATR